MTRKTMLACALCLTAAGPAAAATTGLYAGVLVGKTKYSTTYDFHLDRTTTKGLVAGYRFNRYVAVDLGYNKINTYNYNDPINSITIRTSFSQISVLGSLPLGNTFSAYGRLGAAHAKSSVHWYLGYPAPLIEPHDTTTEAFFGGGIAANLGPAQLRLEYAHANGKALTGNMLSVAALWHFGTPR